MSTILKEKTSRDEIIKWWGEPTDRIKRLKKQMVNAVSELCIERGRIVTDAYKKYEGEPIIVKRALTLKEVLERMPIMILEDEIVLGHYAEKQRSANFFPEMSVHWLDKEINTLYTRPQDKFFVREEIKKELMEEIVPQWRGKTLWDRFIAVLPDETKAARETFMFSVGLHEQSGLGHVQLDYETIVKKGLKAIKEESDFLASNVDMSDGDAADRLVFYKSIRIVCDAAIHYANRYSKLAKEMAEKESNPVRREELLRISEVCSKVPEYPASNFWEAVQSFFFIHLIVHIESDGISISPGRFDQYIYPYLEKDLNDNYITEELAQELIDALWIKFAESLKIYETKDAYIHAGYPQGQNLCVGGIKPDGTDGTNTLSYMCLKSQGRICLNQPNFTVRVHPLSPEEFLVKASKVVANGGGMPQFINDSVFIQTFLLRGIPLREARDYAVVGCVEGSVIGVWGRCNGGYFNITKCLQLALNDGYDVTMQKQIGPHTGDPKTFKSFDDVVEAYTRQVYYWAGQLAVEDNTIDKAHAEIAPTPFTSIMVPDCIKNAKDVTEGGARYNWTGPVGVGIANVGDSLTAIKKAIFEDKIFTLEELIEALNTDFTGKEELRQWLINKIPKYGNDDEYADEMVKLGTGIYMDAIEKQKNRRGGNFVPALLPVAANIPFGWHTAATAEGRHSGVPLADGVSPTHDSDKKGLTSVYRSVSKIDYPRCTNGVIFNQKFSPSTLSKEEDIRKFVNLLRTFMELGGMHVQFNVVSAETLKEAQKSPDKYKDLVVRVAGYSARFTELSKPVQDDIIGRTEQILN
jgi:pyruvate formate-lyase/glycerol dehydratase family glycyl radical enzyme